MSVGEIICLRSELKGSAQKETRFARTLQHQKELVVQSCFGEEI